MAEKMKMNKQLEAPLLPTASVERKKTPAVVLVSQWGLYNAGVLAFVYLLSVYTDAFVLLHVELTDAERAMAIPLRLGYIWCNVLQAAGGTLALLLAGHRRRTRRALAYVVLAAAAAGECLIAGVVVIVLTAELGKFLGVTSSVIIFVHGMVELHRFLALMRSEV